MAKSAKMLEAIRLRQLGESIKVIAKQLDVSAGSVSVWCRGVQLTREQLVELERRSKDPHYGRRLSYSLAQKQKREYKEKLHKELGISEIGTLTKRELFLVGVALYWAEGFKKDSQAGFANSNPRMVCLFIRWLIECCGFGIQDLSLRITVNESHKHRIDEIQDYWSTVTEIPHGSFQMPFYQTVAWKKIYKNHNEYFGVLRIRVRKSTDFLRRIHGWIEGLKLGANESKESAVQNELKFIGDWRDFHFYRENK